MRITGPGIAGLLLLGLLPIQPAAERPSVQDRIIAAAESHLGRP